MASYHLKVYEDMIEIDHWDIPIGSPQALHVDLKTYMVHLVCDKGLGNNERISIDFHLETLEKVRVFVGELLRNSSVYLMRIVDLKTEKKSHSLTVSVSLENERKAGVFAWVVAPVCFPGYQTILDRNQVSLIRVAKDRIEFLRIVQQTNRLFQLLNRHTLNTLNSRLSENQHSPFHKNTKLQIEKIPDTSTLIAYLVTEKGIFKRGFEVPGRFDPLTDNPEGLRALGREIHNLLEEDVPRLGLFCRIYKKIFDAIETAEENRPIIIELGMNIFETFLPPSNPLDL